MVQHTAEKCVQLGEDKLKNFIHSWTPQLVPQTCRWRPMTTGSPATWLLLSP